MILRKPYAFLIKNFKLIHFILTLLSGYILVKTYEVYKFINYFQEQGWVKGIYFNAEDYITPLMYIGVLVAIGILIIVLILMRRKDKPVTFYIVNITFYIALLMMYLITYNILSQMEYKTIDTITINLIADFNFAFFLGQIVAIFFFIKRTLGFDFKKFNFGEDIEQLKIEMSDNEEVEVQLNLDTDSFFTEFRRRKREFGYYYVENKIFFNIILIILAMVLIGLTYLNIFVYNRVYSENEKVVGKNYNYTVLDSYITKENYRGKTIANHHQSYLVVKIENYNKSNKTREIKPSNFKLLIGGLVYNPTDNKSGEFIDLGNEPSTIKSNNSDQFIVVFELNDLVVNKKMYLRITDAFTINLGQVSAKYKKIKLNPIKIDQKDTWTGEAKLTETLEIDNGIINNSSLTIESYELKDKMIYEYDYCIKDNCKKYQDLIRTDAGSNYTKTLLKLEVDYNLAENLKVISDPFDFIKELGIIKYEIDGKEYTHNLVIEDRTPINYNGNCIYLEVLKELEKADKIILKLKVRNDIYKYIIKEN